MPAESALSSASFSPSSHRPTRRQFLAKSSAMAVGLGVGADAASHQPSRPKIAAIVTVYTHNSHADVIVSRLLQTYTLDGKGDRPNLELVSLYADQTPERDLSRTFAKQYGFRLAPTIRDALTLGGKELAVDGVLLIGEHGQYPSNAKGQTLYPRRRFFEESANVMRESRRVVPVFSDKHLSAAWEDAKWMYDTAQAMKIPLMAGSSLPLLWRKPPIDVQKGAKLSELVAVSYHTLDAYGFHALEMVQCLAERRGQGETGLAAVECLEGPEVWKAAERGRFDRRLMDSALERCEQKNRYKGKIEDAAKAPIGCFLEYRDGFKAAILTLNYAVGEWAVAWRDTTAPDIRAALFWTQEERPFGHFSFLVQGIEKMMLTGRPTWPVERTLLTTGALDALHTSKHQGGRRLDTPHLAISYQPTFEWKEPPPPPPGRPIQGQ
jgi:hypothetical protein